MIIVKGGRVSYFTNFETQEIILTITPWYSFIDPKPAQIHRRVKKVQRIHNPWCG